VVPAEFGCVVLLRGGLRPLDCLGNHSGPMPPPDDRDGVRVAMMRFPAREFAPPAQAYRQAADKERRFRPRGYVGQPAALTMEYRCAGIGLSM